MEKSSEEQGIREAIAHYVEGTADRQRREAEARAFTEQAILCGSPGDELIMVLIAPWVAANPSPSATGERFDC